MSSAPIHVLLIEDNPGDARLLRALLQETGSSQFELVHAERFSEALMRLSERRFDVVSIGSLASRRAGYRDDQPFGRPGGRHADCDFDRSQ